MGKYHEYFQVKKDYRHPNSWQRPNDGWTAELVNSSLPTLNSTTDAGFELLCQSNGRGTRIRESSGHNNGW